VNLLSQGALLLVLLGLEFGAPRLNARLSRRRMPDDPGPAQV
jgi:hypothetical protein